MSLFEAQALRNHKAIDTNIIALFLALLIACPPLKASGSTCETGELLLFIDSSKHAVGQTKKCERTNNQKTKYNDFGHVEAFLEGLAGILDDPPETRLYTFDSEVRDEGLLKAPQDLSPKLERRAGTGSSTSLLRVLRKIATQDTRPTAERQAPQLVVVVSDFLDQPADTEGLLKIALQAERKNPGLDLPIESIRDGLLRVLLIKTENPCGDPVHEAVDDFSLYTEASLEKITELSDPVVARSAEFLACPLEIDVVRNRKSLKATYTNRSPFVRQPTAYSFTCDGFSSSKPLAKSLNHGQSGSFSIELTAETFDLCRHNGMNLHVRLKRGPTTAHQISPTHFVTSRLERFGFYDSTNQVLSIGLIFNRAPQEGTLAATISLNDEIKIHQDIDFSSSGQGPLRCDAHLKLERHDFKRLSTSNSIPIEFSYFNKQSNTEADNPGASRGDPTPLGRISAAGEVKIGRHSESRPQRVLLKIALLFSFILFSPEAVRLIDRITASGAIADIYEELYEGSSLAAALTLSLQLLYDYFTIEKAIVYSFLTGATVILAVHLFYDRRRDAEFRLLSPEPLASELERARQKKERCRLAWTTIRRVGLGGALVIGAFLILVGVKHLDLLLQVSPYQSTKKITCASISID